MAKDNYSYKLKDISNIFPIRVIENDILIHQAGDLVLGFELTLPEIFSLNAFVENTQNGREETGDFADIVDSWCKAFRVLMPNTIIHKQDWFMEEKYMSSGNATNFLDKSSELHFHERPFLKHRCFLYIGFVPPSRRNLNLINSILSKGTILPTELKDQNIKEQFFNSVSQFISILKSSRYVKIRPLTAADYIGENGKTGILDRYMTLNLQQDVVPLTDIHMKDGFRIGNNQTRFFTISNVDDLPDYVFTHNRMDSLSTKNSQVSVSFAAPLGLLFPFNHIYNQYVFIEDRQSVLQYLEGRKTKMDSLVKFSASNQINSEQLAAYADYLVRSGENPVKAHFNVQIWHPDINKIPVLRNEVTSAISKLGIRPRESSSDAPFLFWAGIPGNAGDLPDEDRFWTAAPQAVCFFTQETNYYDSPSPVGLKLVDRVSGKPMIVDLSDIPMKNNWITNRNKFIIGPSGSGKSFFTNHACRTYHHQGSHIVIVDVGHSYQGLCDMLGGKYLTYTEDKPISFNPFYIEGGGKPSIEKIEAIKMLIQTLWKASDEKATRSEYTALSAAVNEYYYHLEKCPNIRASFDSFYEFMLQDFPKIIKEKNIKDSFFDYDNFMFVTETFYSKGKKPEFPTLLNSEENKELLHERLIVFELDNIKEHPILYPIVTIIIMDTFISKMRLLKGIRKIILLEEAWKAIMKEGMAEYVKYLYKTVRKFFGEAWLVTQEVNDIISSPIVKDTVIMNADTKILFDQRKYANLFNSVQSLLALSDQEKNIILSMNNDLDPARKYKEVFISWGGQKYKVYGVEVSLEEYYAYSTEEPEKILVQGLLPKYNGSYNGAIKEVADSIRKQSSSAHV